MDFKLKPNLIISAFNFTENEYSLGIRNQNKDKIKRTLYIKKDTSIQ